MPRPRLLLGLLALAVLTATSLLAGAPAETKAPAPKVPAAQIALYDKEVKPLLAQHCLHCHGADKLPGGLNLASRDSILQGGDGGPAVDLKTPAASRLLQALHHDGQLKMPPKTRLSDKEIAVFSRWVAAGLPFPATGKNYWA